MVAAGWFALAPRSTRSYVSPAALQEFFFAAWNACGAMLGERGAADLCTMLCTWLFTQLYTGHTTSSA